jgi:hypothetical protein
MLNDLHARHKHTRGADGFATERSYRFAAAAAVSMSNCI